MYRACEFFEIIPPGAQRFWDDCSITSKAELIAYSQIRILEDSSSLM